VRLHDRGVDRVARPGAPSSTAGRGTERRYGAGEKMVTSSLNLTMERPDAPAERPRPSGQALSRSLVALDQDSTITAVVELSNPPAPCSPARLAKSGRRVSFFGPDRFDPDDLNRLLFKV